MSSVPVEEMGELLRSEEMRRRKAEAALAAAESELRMLHAQIEPHFLFNSLGAVQQLIPKNPAQADFLLSQLTIYLRQTLTSAQMPDAGTLLGQEFDAAQAYLNIMQTRLGDRLTALVEIDPALRSVPFPTFVLHALVENAIKHGVEPKPGNVCISLTAEEITADAKTNIVVTVVDTGVGFNADRLLASDRTSISRIADRLSAAYENLTQLEILTPAHGGTCVTITIPR